MSRTPAQKRSSERVGNTDSHEGRGAGKSTAPRGREKHAYFTAFFTSSAILASSVAVYPFNAKAVGHMAPSSRFALSLKPSVAYLVLNFCAVWKKQTTLPSLAYAGIPYQSLGERAAALSLMIIWSRLAMVRSGSGISAIFASTAPSPSPLSAPAFSSWMRSFIAPCSSSVNPLNFLLVAVVLLADFCVPFWVGFMKFYSSSELNYFSRVHSLRFNLLRRALGIMEETAVWPSAATLSSEPEQSMLIFFTRQGKVLFTIRVSEALYESGSLMSTPI